MNDEQVTEAIKILKSIDWKLWEMYNMLKDVLIDKDLNNDTEILDDDEE